MKRYSRPDRFTALGLLPFVNYEISPSVPCVCDDGYKPNSGVTLPSSTISRLSLLSVSRSRVSRKVVCQLLPVSIDLQILRCSFLAFAYRALAQNNWSFIDDMVLTKAGKYIDLIIMNVVRIAFDTYGLGGFKIITYDNDCLRVVEQGNCLNPYVNNNQYFWSFTFSFR